MGSNHKTTGHPEEPRRRTAPDAADAPHNNPRRAVRTRLDTPRKRGHGDWTARLCGRHDIDIHFTGR